MDFAAQVLAIYLAVILLGHGVGTLSGADSARKRLSAAAVPEDYRRDLALLALASAVGLAAGAGVSFVQDLGATVAAVSALVAASYFAIVGWYAVSAGDRRVVAPLVLGLVCVGTAGLMMAAALS